jgi:glyceraldehyde 3-phosphate dehydrogenase
MPRVAINGLGRMGKLVVRALFEDGFDGKVVLLNDKAGDPALHAHLLEFDTIHGRWPASFSHDEESLTINDSRMRLTSFGKISELPLAELGVDIAIECTGKFKTPEALAPYYEAGVKKVVVSAPIRNDAALNLVYGINHHLYEPGKHNLVTAASCTTNCLAPVVKVVHENLRIRHGTITTVHDVTNTQTIVDRPHKDWRRARSALNSLIPTTTGSAKAIGLIYPELQGRLNGHAIRVPVLNASLTDCVFEVEHATTETQVNDLFRTASQSQELNGILGYEDRPLVSTDYVNDPRSSIVDGPCTMVVNGTQVKVYAWYDNEWAYAWRLADVTRMVARSL